MNPDSGVATPGPIREFLSALVNRVRSTYSGVARNGPNKDRPDNSKIELTL